MPSMNETLLRPLRPSNPLPPPPPPPLPLPPHPPPHSPDGDGNNNRPATGLTSTVGASAPLGKRATCSQCRIRKVRCDGRGGAVSGSGNGKCANCERLAFECSFQQRPGVGTSPYQLKLPERRRRMQACVPCHAKKMRCLGELPSCSNCLRKGRSCTYPKPRRPGVVEVAEVEKGGGARRRRQRHQLQQLQLQLQQHPLSPETEGHVDGGQGQQQQHHHHYQSQKYHADSDREMVDDSAATHHHHQHTPDSGASSSSSPSSSSSLDDATALALTADYFRHLYPLPSFAFLHEATVTQRCREGTMNAALRLALCAVTAQQLPARGHRHCHERWTAEAEAVVLAALVGRPSIFHLQALLLIVRYRIEAGAFPAAFMLAGLAARAAVALRLNYERGGDDDDGLPPVAQEARRRLFWSLYLLDDFFCVGLREFELCPEETIHLQLPCGEDAFAAGRYARTGPLRPPTAVAAATAAAGEVSVGDAPGTLSLRGVFVRLTSFRRAVMRFNRRVGLGEAPSGTIGDRIRGFEAELAALRATLGPGDAPYSAARLAAHRWPAQLLLVHVSWHQCHCDLHRLALTGYGEAAPSPVLRAALAPAHRAAMQRRCLDHAHAILNILEDFYVHYGGDDVGGGGGGGARQRQRCLLERDAAVCAFESARIAMFGARIPGAKASLEGAIAKARLSLKVITTFFPCSASTRPLRKDLERLISSYSVRLALQPSSSSSSSQQSLLLAPGGDTAAGAGEPEPDEAGGLPQSSSSSAAAAAAVAKVSRYATSRQRLSVQSLLLQSDFVDDSHEIAGGGAAVRRRPPEEEVDEEVGKRDGGGARSSSPVEPAVWGMLPPSQTTTSTVMMPVPDSGGQDDLISNPWMGFTESEDFYGLTGGLNGDY
ncbi:hypothetical protein F4780DRAFT_512152 [Xylariomycetidae sp. FL0641]|nr:hypothetical protein F4780DRAFT_512152 [Xylariomycetidae sp. FL0641]